MRSMQFPERFPWLNGEKERKVDAGNALAVIACRLFRIANAAGARAIFEQPQSSLMWAFNAFKALHSDAKVGLVTVMYAWMSRRGESLHHCIFMIMQSQP